MTDLSPLQTRVEAGIAWLVLNRPQQRNALGFDAGNKT